MSLVRAASLNRAAESRDSGGISALRRVAPAADFVEALGNAGRDADAMEAVRGGSPEAPGQRDDAPAHDGAATVTPASGQPGENANVASLQFLTDPKTPAGAPTGIARTAVPGPGAGPNTPSLLPPQSDAELDLTPEASRNSVSNGRTEVSAAGPARQPPGQYAPPVTLDGQAWGLSGPVIRPSNRSIRADDKLAGEPQQQTVPQFDPADAHAAKTTASSTPSAAADRASRHRSLNDIGAPDPALAVLGATFPSVIPDAATVSFPVMRDPDGNNVPAGTPSPDRQTAPAPVGVASVNSNTAPAEPAGADPARHQSGAVEAAPAAVPATQTSDASSSRSSLNPAASSKLRDNIKSEQSPAVFGGSPQREAPVIDPQILHPGSSGAGSGGPDPNPPVQFAAVPSAGAEKIFSGGPAAGGSSSAAAVSAAPAELSEQLFRHVMGSIGNGTHEVVLRLHPTELGDLTIRLAVSGRDVSAWFATPQIQVQQAISEAIGQLHSNLGNAGYSLAGAWVGNDAANQSGGHEPPPPPSPTRQAVGTASLELPSATPISSSRTGVSVYV